MNAANILGCINAQGVRLRTWIAGRLWAKLVAGALLLPLMGVIQVPLGIQAGIPAWLTIIALVLAYVAYGVLTVFLHRKYSQPALSILGDDADLGTSVFVDDSVSREERLAEIRRMDMAQRLTAIRQRYDQVFPMVVQMDLPDGYIHVGNRDHGPVVVGDQKIYAVGSPEYNAQIMAAIHQINAQLAPSGQRVPERIIIGILSAIQQAAARSGSPDGEQTDDEQGKQNGGQE
jgi:hypothetical protein